MDVEVAASPFTAPKTRTKKVSGLFGTLLFAEQAESLKCLLAGLILQEAAAMADVDGRDYLITERSTAKILGISCDTLRRLGRRDEGPRRRKISPRRVGYKLSEVEAYRDGTMGLGAGGPAQTLSASRGTHPRRYRSS